MNSRSTWMAAAAVTPIGIVFTPFDLIFAGIAAVLGYTARSVWKSRAVY